MTVDENIEYLLNEFSLNESVVIDGLTIASCFEPQFQEKLFKEVIPDGLADAHRPKHESLLALYSGQRLPDNLRPLVAAAFVAHVIFRTPNATVVGFLTAASRRGWVPSGFGDLVRSFARLVCDIKNNFNHSITVPPPVAKTEVPLDFMELQNSILGRLSPDLRHRYSEALKEAVPKVAGIREEQIAEQSQGGPIP